MKRILFVIDSLGSGGAEKSLISLLRLLDYRRYRVDLLLFAPKGLYLPLLPAEVNLLEPPAFFERQRAGAGRLLRDGRWGDLWARARASLAIRRPLRRRRYHGAQLAWRSYADRIEPLPGAYDVAVAYSQGMPTYFVADKVRAKKKLTWLNTDYIQANYNPAFDRGYYASFDKVVTVSEAGRDIFAEAFPDMGRDAEVVYDIVSPRLIREMADDSEAFEDDGFEDDGFRGVTVLTIGRLVLQKGYDLAVRACRMLADDGIDVRWCVIGEGEYEAELRQEIARLGLESRFLLLGTRQNPYPYLRRCDVYAQPSRFEGFGLAVAEARILGKPIVATNYPAVHDQIRHETNGLVCSMTDRELYAAVKRLIEDEALRRRLGATAAAERVGTEAELEKIYTLLDASS